MTCTSSHLTVRGFLQAYRIAHYELGPRQFWWYWCGGLKVHDAMSVALWLALNILCVQQRTCLELPLLLGILSQPPCNGCIRSCCGVPALEVSFECPAACAGCSSGLACSSGAKLLLCLLADSIRQHGGDLSGWNARMAYLGT